VTAGRRVSYAARGGVLSSLRALARVQQLSFYGRVVRFGAGGLALRLNDRGLYRIAPRSRSRTHRPRAVSSFKRLRPGQVVLVTVSDDGKGDTAITTKLVDPSPGDTNQGPTVNDQEVTGTVTAIAADRSSVTVEASATGPKTFRVNDPDILDRISVGDRVAVSYYRDGNELVADDVSSAKQSGDGSDNSDDGDITGTGDESQSDSGDASGDGDTNADGTPSIPTPGAPKPGTPKPGTPKPPKPGTPKPPNPQPGTPKPGTSKPPNTQPGTSKPGTSKPANPQPGH
jgi:hypothetical protein